MTRDEAKIQIQQLIDKFILQKEYYKSVNYNEAQTRQDFINPFFEALGWDMNNRKDQLETYRDVRHEDKIKINGHSKAPDYSFNLNGKRKFFVEAKKPAIPIKDNPEPALQVRNYGWNANLSISVVTDFEEFAVYDCTKKPKSIENANAKRLKYIYFTDYIKEFDFLYDTFGYEAVVKGSIEQYSKSKINFKNAEPVDKEFLKSIELWREELAKNISRLNTLLDEDQINYAVQQTIDRIVFLKVCEDRKIEPENNLFRLVKEGNFYKNLFQYFLIADQKYNSGLFNFAKDKVTENLEIDNKTVKKIINELYGKTKENATEFGYNFAIIPVEILGLAYEQFLGKVIRLTAGHNAKVEEKPEVRKAGGVYYTPEYIVDYIVQNTLGMQIEGKTPEQVSKIKVLDPSCGSGSFLLGAYRFLLDWHLKYYAESKEYKTKHSKYLSPEGNLTSSEKKRILLNNIFGVDIDAQAVEVTKLSLLLKALEGETEASVQTSLQLFNERVLPTIDNNIQCGNSLIEPDFDGLGLTPKEERKVNVFPWETSFSKVMKKVKFDCIIGNPPYVSSKEIPDFQKKYFEKIYSTATGQYDLYTLFIEKGIGLLSETGMFCYIIPDAILDRSSASRLRKHILENANINSLLQINGVFDQASVSSAIINLSKTKTAKNEIVFLKYENPLAYAAGSFAVKRISQENIAKVKNSSFLFINDKELVVLNKIYENKTNLGSVTFMGRGEEIGKSSEIVKTEKIENSRQFIFGQDIHRYSINYKERFVVEKAIKKAPALYENKIIVRQVGKEINASFDDRQAVTLQSIYSIIPNENISVCYILGILNSKLINFVYQKLFRSKEIFPRILLESLRELPFIIPAISNSNEKTLHDQIVLLVEKMLDLNRQLNQAKLQTEKDNILRRIAFTDAEIDKKVYELYNLTPDEIAVIEGE